ncbi:hypothetical protein VD0002_g2794 [Verticillium dahliae]|uniref:HAD-superfamily subfamily IIA hydrolase n=2 Tax=Verticillium dahliae TaxID=27337 RepID=G2XCV2_VERDV|nr:uncharacterized protein VDAG_07984 [Verticillium dahliae VdLs.17]KAF3345580.1 Putative cystathionine gamma-synthase [Verticillium dahliae VDG2]KAF3355089.1 hypothetical protein VdG1_04301 [Verticillium dahliae VDG1]KAH6706807.1 HAD-like domain-containing protein [Verticillium dahliae]EGY16820.1 hypothetical protein VDAG_07984 [Verticillium dahliae VdLs.17]PNH27870.1 hypothetical protein BJF96_g8859 [Verticillium dahliae]
MAAFVFDIDGVLSKGSQPLPGAKEALQVLQARNIPFIFLTNGGGLTEEAHVEKLRVRLGLDELDENQFIQSHTPYQALVPEYGERTILALGGHSDNVRNLAHAYGFRKVVTSSDLYTDHEHIHPFPEMTRDHHSKHGRKDPVSPLDNSTDGSESGDSDDGLLRIHAILVWNSPRDWCLDLQVILDLLLSVDGIVGTRSPKNGDATLPNAGYLQDGQPRLFFSNPDFEWATQHAQPRLAQGAFREALCGLWAYKTRGLAQLDFTVVGKPTEATYVYGENALEAWNEQLEQKRKSTAAYTIETVFMIGDNPESDIAGANSFQSRKGYKWESILVESGVFAAGTKPVHQPTHITKDVKSAVEWALRQVDA